MMVYGLFILVTQSNNANGWCLGFYVSCKGFSVLVLINHSVYGAFDSVGDEVDVLSGSYCESCIRIQLLNVSEEDPICHCCHMCCLNISNKTQILNQQN